jgi:hypothetical protein
MQDVDRNLVGDHRRRDHPDGARRPALARLGRQRRSPAARALASSIVVDVMPWDRDPAWKRRMTKANLALHGEVSAVLYEDDPEGFGATIGAPLDEYDTIAARLIAAIRDLDGDVPAAANSMYSSLSEASVDRITRAWQTYEAT